jgi:hypothetical protein
MTIYREQPIDLWYLMFAAVYNGLPLRCHVSGKTGTNLKL